MAAPFRFLVSLLLSVGGPLAASAHPGHDHGDIPSLVRHPFAGPEHVAGLALLALGAAVVVRLAWRTRRTTRNSSLAQRR